MRLLHAGHDHGRRRPASRATDDGPITEEEVRHGIEGNLCRCTGYHNIVKAVQAAAEEIGEGDGMSTIEETPTAKHVGQSMRRKEDPRLITGRATYVDDFVLHGMLYMAVVRSPEAHAKILSIDASAALARPGVKAVYTGEDMSDLLAPLPMAWAPPGVEIKTPERWPLARGEVNHVGDAVAMVIGEDKYDVVDAAAVRARRVRVAAGRRRRRGGAEGRDPRPRVARHEQDARVVDGRRRRRRGDRRGRRRRRAADRQPPHRRRRDRDARRASPSTAPASLTVWSSTQVPHLLRLFYAVQMGIPEDHVRVIAPEVGGGFGGKLQVCAEETLCAWAAKELGRPVKWIETRSEAMAVSHHGRDQVDHVRMAATSDGTITAFDANIIQDCGAYFGLLTPMIPELGAFVMTGCYAIPNVQTNITGVLTNTYITDAIRGAGRPEMTHMLEVTIDLLAEKLGMDPLELRRKNFIAPEDFPYTTPYGITYDSGDYAAALDRALEILDLDAFRAEQASLREQGILRGVGFSTYTEICGLAPSRAVGPKGFGLGIGLYESALVRVHPTGLGDGLHRRVAARPGPRDGLRADRRRPPRHRPGGRRGHPRRHGDRPDGPRHVRLALAGDRRRRVRARRREARAEVQGDRRVQLRGRPWTTSRSGSGGFSLAGDPEQDDDARRDRGLRLHRRDAMPEGMELGLEQTLIYDPTNFVFPFGTHICVVDVDANTGKVEIVRWVAVDDCGPAINPMLIDGQVHGGVTHGIGQALFEQVVYDDRGQLIDRHVHGLRAADGGRDPELRARSHRDEVAVELARRQGHRRGRHDRRRRRRSSTRSSTRCATRA